MHLHRKLNYLRIGMEPVEPSILIAPIAANIVENASDSPTEREDNHIVVITLFNLPGDVLRGNKIISLFLDRHLFMLRLAACPLGVISVLVV